MNITDMTAAEIIALPKNQQTFAQITDAAWKEHDDRRRLIIVAIRDFLFADTSPYCCYDCAGRHRRDPLITQYLDSTDISMPIEFFNVVGFLHMLSKGKLLECKKFQFFNAWVMEALNSMKIEYNYLF